MIDTIKSFFSRSNTLYVLRFICRYYIAFQLFSYAFGKILKTQFNLGLEYALDRNISYYDGLALTWTYFGFSRGYGLVIATTQIIAAIFLLFRKTERIGTILVLTFMVNILFIDFFYGIDGAKSMAIRLNIMGAFLLISDWKVFKAYFFKIPTTIASYLPVAFPKELKKIHFLKYFLILSLIIYDFNYINTIKNKYFSKNEVFGVWRNHSLVSTYKCNSFAVEKKLLLRFFPREKSKEEQRKASYLWVVKLKEYGSFNARGKIQNLYTYRYWNFEKGNSKSVRSRSQYHISRTQAQCR